MIDYAQALQSASQTIRQADIYLRGIDSFLKNINDRLQASETDRLNTQTKLDAEIGGEVKTMDEHALNFFTQWEQATTEQE
ncbi:MAG: hypothetical protein ABIP54_00665 [Candidatus Andersenbacteria bacterium]